MVLLSRILSHDEAETTCAVEVGGQALFRDAAGDMGAWVGLELMAQCIAAHAGLVGRETGDPPQVAFLLGSRRVQFHRSRYHRGQTLTVRVTHTWGKATGLVAFQCSIEDAATGDCLAEGRINCFVPEDGAKLEGMA
jgi:predicted hotdog family 3-hydroxylacyl-ACP dehydratase